MTEQQNVVFVRREGSSVKGEQWRDFMQAQQDTLDSCRMNGWKLVTAIGVHDEKALGGVLLYFSKDG
jgi:hypothetical protein